MHFVTSTKQFAILQRHPQQRRPQQQHSTQQSSLDFVYGVVGRLSYKPDDGSGGAVVSGFRCVFHCGFRSGWGGYGFFCGVSVIVSVTVGFTVGFTVVFVVVFVRLSGEVTVTVVFVSVVFAVDLSSASGEEAGSDSDHMVGPSPFLPCHAFPRSPSLRMLGGSYSCQGGYHHPDGVPSSSTIIFPFLPPQPRLNHATKAKT
jgi:hypothetical protein